MARPYKSRPTTKTEQLVLRLRKDTTSKLADIVNSSPFPTTRVGVIEKLIDDAHAALKGKK